MIIPLYDTTANQIAEKLVAVRREGGAIALSRVLTLLVPVGAAAAEQAITAANEASMEHPCRVIVLVERDLSGQPTLDAEIRVGGDAGASEVVVLRLRGSLIDHQDNLITPLLLPDVPIVTWWPDRLPDQPASTPLGTLAVHRVTNVLKAPGSLDERLAQLQRGYTAGDTDLAWTRITWWRAHLAAVVEHSPYEPVTHAVIHTYADNPSAHLLAAWLGTRLNCTIQLVYQRDSTGMTRVELHRQTGMVAINRPEGSDVATLTMPGTPDQRFRLSHRTLAECLSEELRRPGEDTVYGQVIEQGLPWLSQADHVSDAHAD